MAVQSGHLFGCRILYIEECCISEALFKQKLFAKAFQFLRGILRLCGKMQVRLGTFLNRVDVCVSLANVQSEDPFTGKGIEILNLTLQKGVLQKVAIFKMSPWESFLITDILERFVLERYLPRDVEAKGEYRYKFVTYLRFFQCIDEMFCLMLGALWFCGNCSW